jgi:hypothetical protein
LNTKKIFILLPDGVGLRNFAFTSFVKVGEKMGWEVIFWNHTPFDLKYLGYKEIKLEGRIRSQTDILKKAKITAELNYFTKKFDDSVYQNYKFQADIKNLRSSIKNLLVNTLIKTHRTEESLQSLRKKMKASERKGNFYSHCKTVLKKEKPDLVFCTNQRPVSAIAPLTAAQDLGIPTATFIFSWDNLPKATMVVEPDYYFVWSEHMKSELLSYYPYIHKKQVHVTGSPQFEPHYDLRLRQSREVFFEEHGLDLSKKYICFSGDDITTSPDDPQYLRDLAEATIQLNKNGENLGIIFRRCPTDFSDRYDSVLQRFKNLIAPIAPVWEKTGENWNTILPKKEDLGLLVNTILHSEAVVNVGSSMVFDFAIFGKPCLFIKYEANQKVKVDWYVHKVYNFVHFRSMPTGKEVYWLNSKEEIANKIKDAISKPAAKAEVALKWFQTINKSPVEKANIRIWKELKGI